MNAALQCLIRINSRFRNAITVNEDALEQLSVDGSIAEHLKQIVEPDGEEEVNNSTDPAEQEIDESIDLLDQTNAPNIMIPSERDRVNGALNINEGVHVIQQPELNRRKVNELTEGLVALAFPCLFPTGQLFNLGVYSSFFAICIF